MAPKAKAKGGTDFASLIQNGKAALAKESKERDKQARFQEDAARPYFKFKDALEKAKARLEDAKPRDAAPRDEAVAHALVCGAAMDELVKILKSARSDKFKGKPEPRDAAEVGELLDKAADLLRDAALGAAGGPRSLTAAALRVRLVKAAIDDFQLSASTVRSAERKRDLLQFALDVGRGGWEDEAAFYPVRVERALLAAPAAAEQKAAAAAGARELLAEAFAEVGDTFNAVFKAARASERAWMQEEPAKAAFLALITEANKAKAAVAKPGEGEKGKVRGARGAAAGADGGGAGGESEGGGGRGPRFLGIRESAWTQVKRRARAWREPGRAHARRAHAPPQPRARQAAASSRQTTAAPAPSARSLADACPPSPRRAPLPTAADRGQGRARVHQGEGRGRRQRQGARARGVGARAGGAQRRGGGGPHAADGGLQGALRLAAGGAQEVAGAPRGGRGGERSRRART